MPGHTDAVGYLNELVDEINEPWFRMICDLASGKVSTLDEPALETLFALFSNNASYLKPGKSPNISTSVVANTTSTDKLEKLSNFSNFKLLGNSLEVNFEKRITLIFGTNGSGKSSLCEALKVLSASETPAHPLQNVRSRSTTPPEFQFKFKSDAAHQTWTPSTGYGPRRMTVKYFDKAIAIKNVKNPVEPGRVIVLTPFKLHLFELVKDLATQFRSFLQKAQVENSDNLSESLLMIRTEFSKFRDRPLVDSNDKTLSLALSSEIKLGEGFINRDLLSEKQAKAVELEKAASEEGLKLLRVEHRELEMFLLSLNKLLDSTASLWSIEPENKRKLLMEKQTAQEVLAKALIPKEGTLDGLLSLLRAASPICNMGNPIGHECPLCKRQLGVSEIELFKQYHALLVGELEKEIEGLKDEVSKAEEFVRAALSVDRNAWDTFTTIQREKFEDAKTASEVIANNLEVFHEPKTIEKTAFEDLKRMTEEWSGQLAAKKIVIDVAEKGRAELNKQLREIQAEIAPLEYAQAIADRLEQLKTVEEMVILAAFWNEKLPGFTKIFKRITEKAKEAYEKLVVSGFETRMNAEYIALAEKDMATFGVTLASKGADAAVTVSPQIGGKWEIEGVLSEGEQRIHALSLFFAELETCSQSVVVFDDPISSFDYNYIANYCNRLRNFIIQYPWRQIIVLTHNWEFFVQLQTTLNKATLDSQMSIHVLENCSVIAEYSEKIDDLKANIEVILRSLGEPSKDQKEDLAGKMRRLIETVVNSHVFNHQRHQYKQKSQQITAFQSFTKIVPLLSAEATTLSDLYAKLSISEHDDPRNAYVNTDKAMFQTRYDQILKVEAAIEGRKPS